MTQPVGLAAVLAAEQAAIAAGAAACGYTCVDHGGHTCQRVNDPGDPTADPPRPPGHLHDESPHIATLPDGSLVQWHVGECLTAQQIADAAAAAAAERQAATHGILANLDPQLLIQLLVQGGYVSPTVVP